MALWLFDSFLGRIAVALIAWTLGGLLLSDDPKAPPTRSGRTSIKAILRRYIFVGSIPIWGFFVLFGVPWLSLPGEIKQVYGMPTQTEWGYVIDIVYTFCVVYTAWLGALVLLAVLHTGVMEFIFRNDPEHQQWKKTGGQIFFDSLEGPYNNDPDEVRWSMPSSLPPTANCPQCQGDFTLANGCQCGNCGLFWDGQQWLKPTT